MLYECVQVCTVHVTMKYQLAEHLTSINEKKDKC